MIVHVARPPSFLAILHTAFFLSTFLQLLTPPPIANANVLEDGKLFDLNVWDTSGSKDYDKLRPHLYTQANIFLVCFSVAEPISLSNVLDKWVPELKQHCPLVPFLLVGTKIDLRSDPQTIERLAKIKSFPVSAKDGKVMARRIGASSYLECSALAHESLEIVFKTAIAVTLQVPLDNSKYTESIWGNPLLT